MYDNHVHCFFSGDSDMPTEVACSTAINLGLTGIAFTDHLDIDYPNYDNVFNINFDEYEKHISNVQTTYVGQLDVIHGIEVGIQPTVIIESNKIISSYPFDFVIASVHIVDKMDLHNGDFCRNKSKSEATIRYFEEVLAMINSFDNFDILGHLDLIRRYGDYTDKTLSLLDYQDLVDTIFKALIQKGKGIEVNASGYRYGLDSSMPTQEFVKRYFELGGSIITLGSDAHSPNYIGYQFKSLTQMIKQAGFDYLCHFKNRMPVFEKII